MSELGSFSELANVRVGDVEPPKAFPVGHYRVQITGMMKEKKAKSGNLGMDFPVTVIEPLDDVDAEAFAALTAEQRAKVQSLVFWMSPDARFRFTDFGKAMGHSDDLNLLELAEALATSGEPFMMEARLEPNEKNPDKPYTRFDNPAPLSSYTGS